MKIYNLPKTKLSLSDFIHLCTAQNNVRISKEGQRAIKRGMHAVRALLEKKVTVYGVNTGVGDLCDVVLPTKDLRKLQENIILGHACGSAPYLEERVCRGALLLTMNALSKGDSGMTHKTIQKLITYFNKGVSPLLPAQGSLGASGDLIPLAHLGLMLMGRGNVYQNGRVVSAAGVFPPFSI